MRSLTVFEQRWRNRWKKTARVFLTIVTLSAVAAGGLALFGSEVLAAWKTPGKAEREHTSSGAFKTLLNFEAPASTVAKFEAKKEEAENSLKMASEGDLNAKNWKYTAFPLSEQIAEFAFTQTPVGNQIYQNAQALYFFGLGIVVVEGLADRLGFGVLDRYFATLYKVDQILMSFYTALFNRLGLPSLIQPALPPLPSPASPYF